MNDRKWKIVYSIFLFSYTITLLMIMCITEPNANLGDLPYFDKISRCLNIVPFKNLGTFKQIVGSFIIYIPFAILVPNTFTCLKVRTYFHLFSLVFVSTIEILQLLTLHGYADINDVIFGYLGTIIIYELMAFFKSIKKQQVLI